MHFRNCLLFVLSFCAIPVFSQQLVTIKGVIVDEETKEPVPFATIRLTGKSWGTISNIEGKFQLHIPDDALHDSLEVSCIGYVEAFLRVKDLSVRQWADISLQKSVLELKQVVVTNLTPREIVEKAIRKIPENYVASPTALKGFYRTASRENGRFVKLLEAATLVNFGKSLRQKPSPEVHYFNVRKSEDYRHFKNKEAGLLEAALSFDHVHERKGFLNPLNLDLWQFELVGFTQLNSQDIYIIEARFIANPEVLEHKASIYLATDSYAVVKVSYQYSWHGRHPHFYNDSLFISDISWKGTFLYSRSEEVNKYYLNYFTFQNKKELFGKDRKRLAELEVFNEFHVQQLKTSLKGIQGLNTAEADNKPEEYQESGTYQFQNNPGMAVETEFYRTVLADLKWCEEKAGQLPDSLVAE